MNKTILKTIVILTSIVLFMQCKKEPKRVNENELITRVDLLFTDSTDNSTQTFLYCVNDAIFQNRKDTIQLFANTTYGLQLKLYNSQSETNIDTVTFEIENEAEEHQLFVISSRIADFFYLDADQNNYPIGLISTFTTGNSSSSIDNFRVLLIHEPNKAATGVKDGNSANAGGSTDVDATLKIKILDR